MAQQIQALDEAGNLKEYHQWVKDGHPYLDQDICDGWYAAGGKKASFQISRELNTGKMSIVAVILELPDDKTKRAACYKFINDYFKKKYGQKNDEFSDDGEPYIELEP